MPSFPYIGKACTPAEFADYVAHYDFGTVPPDYVVFHHTAIPAASWAPSGDPKNFWDAGEAGLSLEQIKAKRLRQLGNLKNYYQNTLGWGAGPHLFIDDRFILLMTPMSAIGIHAMWGNSFKRGGKLHYGIGIEVVGCYTKVQWPPAVQANVRAAVQTLQKRLQTFTLDYMYADGLKPGRAVDGAGNAYCPHPERLRFGGLSSHRDYNKPSCPGDTITENFYLLVVRGLARLPTRTVLVRHATPIYEGPAATFPIALGGTARIAANRPVEVDATEANGWLHLASGVGFLPPEALTPTLPPPPHAGEGRGGGAITADSTIFGPPSATQDQAVAAILARRPDASYTPFDVKLIVSHYFRVCATVGVDPIMCIAQMMHETGTLTDWHSLRPHRNPAGIGVTQDHLVGVSFKDWGQSVVAQVGRLIAYFTTPAQRTPAQQQLVTRALAERDLPAAMHGSARCLRQLGQVHNPSGRGWAMPGQNYGNKLAEYANAIAHTRV